MVSCTRQGGNAKLRRCRRCIRRYLKRSRPMIVMPMTVALSLATLVLMVTSGMLNSAEALLQFDQVPERTTNQPSATFTYVCTPLDDNREICEDVQYSLDYSRWRPASMNNSSVMLYGLSDGPHTLQLKHGYGDAGSSGEDSTESMSEFEWTVDTIAPNTIIDSGPSQEGEAPRPEETDPFLFFTFHCSEDSCSYRYQFDNLIELAATWEAVDANGLEGHVTVTQVSEDLEEDKAKFQISVFLTVSSSYSDPDDPQPMPATVSIKRYTDGTSSGSEGSGASSTGGSATGNETVESGSGALVERLLGPPEVDSGTGNTVFSLSTEEQVPGHLELNSSLYVEVWTNSSVLLYSAGLVESITSKEWLRWPYASELPGSHTVAIAAVDEAGNVDPMPAQWSWSVDARPRTSLDSAPQAETASDTAFFAFSCALPGGDAEATAAEQETRNSLHGVDLDNNSDNDDGSNKYSSSSSSEGGNASVGGHGIQGVGEGDGGWEIRDGGECTYFYSLDGGNFTAVELPVLSSSAGGGVSTSSEASSSISGEGNVVAGSSSRALLLTGLADGEHVLSVYACKTNSTECDPEPLTHSWITDTSAPVTSIVSFPDSLTPSQFNFSSSKPLSCFMCKVDPGRWRDCTEQSEFPLPDGLYTLSVIAVDPTGRSDPTPVNYSWEVSMLETTVEYCPPARVAVDDEAHRVLLGASYDGVPCATAMDCRIQYSLEWASPTPAVPAPSSAGGGAEKCAAPPTAAPSPIPFPSPSHTRPDGSSENGAGTPSPTMESDGGGGGNEGGDGEIVGTVPGQHTNYLSQTVVRCAEEWANCSALEATTSYNDIIDGDGCTKLETVDGQIWHNQGTLILQDLLPGEYNLTFKASNGFGGVDRSPVMCLFSVLEENETVNQTQIVLVRKPPKVMDNPDQTPALFEFVLEGNAATTAAAASSLSPSSSSSEPRLSYLLSEPETAGNGGAASDNEWQAVPVVGRDEWDELVGDSGSSTSSVNNDGDFVWGLTLNELDDGEYRLQVRDNLLEDTAEYSWNVDMAVPQLTLDISPQDPSHSAESAIFLRCSKLSCDLEYEVNENGAWHLSDTSSINAASDSWEGAGALASPRHGHRSGAPTPTPAEGRHSQATSSGGGGVAGMVGNNDDSDDDDDDNGTEDMVVVSVFSQQVSDHELAFRVHVTVPDSGNYTLAIRPADVYSGASSNDDDDRKLIVELEVDLTRPETTVLSGPDAVTTEGSAMFEFGCEFEGEEQTDSCLYEYQITAVGSVEDKVEVDWDSMDWVPTVSSVTLYEIGEGVNIIRVRAKDASTNLYDLVPAEVMWIRDATAPQLEWQWTPEETSHLSDALFEFTCSGELPLDQQPLAFVEGGQHFWPQQHRTQGNQQLQRTRSTASSFSHSLSPSSMTSSSSSSDSNIYSVRANSHDPSAVASAALSVAYPSADPHILPSGCAFEGSLDGADFEPVPNSVTHRGLSNGDHRFSVIAKDLAGNVAPTARYNWTVNTSDPETIIIACPAPTASSTSASFRILDTVNATDGKGEFEYRLDGKPDNTSWYATSNTTLTFWGLEDGVHTLTVRAKEGEEAGGSSDQVPEVVTWTVDTTCPDTTFVVLPEVVTHLTSDVLVVKGDPDAVSFEYALSRLAVEEDSDDDDGGGGGGGGGSSGDDGGGNNNEAVGSQGGGDDSTGSGGGGGGGSSSAGGGEESEERVWHAGDSSGVIHLHHLQEGRHEIRVRAVDSAGNVDPSPAIYSWIVDGAGVYGHPSMATDVVAASGNKKAYVSWAPPADDGGEALTKYIVVASTAYADISVEAIATVSPETVGEEPPTETTFTGLTNGLVYSFQVVAANAFGHSARSLPSDKVELFRHYGSIPWAYDLVRRLVVYVMTYDPANPCGLVTCGDHGSCFIERSESNALRGYCVCRPGYSGEDCSVAETAGDDSALVYGAYPGSWGECDTKCGEGTRYRSVQCMQYVKGIPMTFSGDNSFCWEVENEDNPSQAEMTQGSCRHVACLAMFLDVTMRLRAFYDDACFTVAAQEAFLSGFAAEVAHALNIKWELVIDLNVLRTNRHNEMEVRFIIAPGESGNDQPIENLRQQLMLQGDSETSRLRTQGTWARKLIPDSLEVSQGTYELPPLSVKGIASDLVMILMSVGTTCLAVAVYGACSSRKSKKWDSVYDGVSSRSSSSSISEEYRQDGPPPSSSSERSTTSQEPHGDAGTEGGGVRAGAARRSGWFQLDDDSEDSYSDWDEEDEEDETSPFFGRCALRLLCRPEEVTRDSASSGDGAGANGASAGSGGECERQGVALVDGSGCGELGFESRFCCRGHGDGDDDDDDDDDDVGIELRTITPAASTTQPSGLESVVPIPLTGKNRPPLPLPGDVNLHRRRGWGVGGGAGQDSAGLSTTRDVEEGSRSVPRSARVGGRSAVDAGLETQRPGRQAIV